MASATPEAARTGGSSAAANRSLSDGRSITADDGKSGSPVSTRNSSKRIGTVEFPVGLSTSSGHATFRAVSSFLGDHAVLSTIETILRGLLSETAHLPFSPYPSLLQTVRVFHERSSMFTEADDVILEKLDQRTANSHSGYVESLHNSPLLWGLRPVLRVVHEPTLARFQWLVDAMAATAQEHVHRRPGYDCQVVASLVGSYALAGRLIQHPTNLQVCLEYLVWGSSQHGSQHSQEEALKLFADSVIADVKEMLKNTLHPISGFLLKKDDGSSDHWPGKSLTSNRAVLRQAIMTTALTKHACELQCFFSTDEHGARYEAGSKQYILHFVESATNDQPEERVSFTQLPLATLHSGVFMQPSAAKSYLSVFLPRHTRHGNSVAVSDRAGWPPAEGLAQRVLRPDDESVLEQLRTSWTASILEEWPENVFAALHTIATLLLLHRDGIEDVLIDIYCASRSRSAVLFRLRERLFALAKVIADFAEDPAKMPFLVGHFLEVHADLFECLDVMEPGRYSLSEEELVVAFLAHEILDDVVIEDRCLVTAGIEMEEKLRTLCDYMTWLLVMYRDAVVENCPVLQDFLDQLKTERAAERLAVVDAGSPTPAAPRSWLQAMIGQTTRTDKDKQPVEEPGESAEKQSFTYGHKEPRRYGYLEVKVVSAQGTGVPADSQPDLETAQLIYKQYAADTRIDLCVRDFLLDLCTRPCLPSSPWSLLINHLRTAHLKFLLWQESKRRCLQWVQQNSAHVRVENVKYQIHCAAGGAFFGHFGAVAGVDGKLMLSWLPNIMSNFANIDLHRREGKLQLFTALALSGLSPLYGQITPYLLRITLHEYYYFRGPAPDNGSVVNILADAVLQHLLAVAKYQRFIMTEFVVYSKPPQHWSLIELIGNTALYDDFKTSVATALSRDQLIVLNAYHQMDWRYVLVEKFFLLVHTDKHSRKEMFFPPHYGEMSLHQNIFDNSSKAADHASVFDVDEIDLRDPDFVRDAIDETEKAAHAAAENHKHMEVYRWLACKSLLQQQFGSSLVLECWRVHHSLAATLEYLFSLSEDLQQILPIAEEQLLYLASHQPPNKTKKAKKHFSPPMLFFEMKVVISMVIAYRDKLAVLKDSFFGFSASFLDRIEACLSAIPGNSWLLHSPNSILDPKVLASLAQINALLTPASRALHMDIMAISPGSSQELEAIKLKHARRGAGRRQSTVREDHTALSTSRSPSTLASGHSYRSDSSSFADGSVDY